MIMVVVYDNKFKCKDTGFPLYHKNFLNFFVSKSSFAS